MNQINHWILDAINNLIKKALKTAKFDYTFSGKILTDNGNGTYDVLYNDQTLNNVKSKDGLSLLVNDIVYIRVVQNNFSEKYIDCKRP